jgi:hypothetical protein
MGLAIGAVWPLDAPKRRSGFEFSARAAVHETASAKRPGFQRSPGTSRMSPHDESPFAEAIITGHPLRSPLQ